MASDKYISIPLDDLESLMMGAACLRGVYSAVQSHKQDPAVRRTATNVDAAVRNAAKLISNVRHVPDPMESEHANERELKIMVTLLIDYEGQPVEINPLDPITVSMLKKRLIVMGRMTGTIHWGDGTESPHQSSDKIVWKLTDKGVSELSGQSAWIS